MGVKSLPKTVSRQRCSCDLSPGSTAPQSSTLTTRLPNDPANLIFYVFLLLLAIFHLHTLLFLAEYLATAWLLVKIRFDSLLLVIRHYWDNGIGINVKTLSLAVLTPNVP